MADTSTINISKQFLPRRGKKTTMATTKADLVLAAGELFVEYPDTGVGTGAHRIKIGDGVTTYANLPYALGGSASETTVAFTESTAASATDALALVTSGANLADITANLKKAIELTAAEATTYTLSSVADADNNDAKIVLTPSQGAAQEIGIAGEGDVTVTSDDQGNLVVAYAHPTSGVTAGDYIGVTVDDKGHITAGTKTIDASAIATGTIDIARLPHGALERLVVVADETAMLALTADDIQTGDTVKNDSTNEMFFVVDESKLGTMDAFVVYTAGEATSVEWTGIQNVPTEVVNLATVQKAQDDAIAALQLTAVQMTGATDTTNGAAGYVPAPTAGQESFFLMGNGTWGTIAEATDTTAGLMSATDKAVVDAVSAGAWDFGDEG